MLTEPKVAFTVPLDEIARAQIGNPISLSTATSRQPASRMTPFTPRAFSDVAMRSPIMPSVLSVVQPSTTISPGWHCSIATWIIQLSQGATETVTAEPEMRAPA